MSVTDIGTDRTRYNLDRTDGKGFEDQVRKERPLHPDKREQGGMPVLEPVMETPHPLSHRTQKTSAMQGVVVPTSFSRQTGAGHPSPNSLLSFYLYLSLTILCFFPVSCNLCLSIMYPQSFYSSFLFLFRFLIL
jgi:hypothetical protein